MLFEGTTEGWADAGVCDGWVQQKCDANSLISSTAREGKMIAKQMKQAGIMLNCMLLYIVARARGSDSRASDLQTACAHMPPDCCCCRCITDQTPRIWRCTFHNQTIKQRLAKGLSLSLTFITTSLSNTFPFDNGNHIPPLPQKRNDTHTSHTSIIWKGWCSLITLTNIKIDKL